MANPSTSYNQGRWAGQGNEHPTTEETQSNLGKVLTQSQVQLDFTYPRNSHLVPAGYQRVLTLDPSTHISLHSPLLRCV